MNHQGFIKLVVSYLMVSEFLILVSQEKSHFSSVEEQEVSFTRVLSIMIY